MFSEHYSVNKPNDRTILVTKRQKNIAFLQTNPLLIRIDTKAGHGFGKPTAKIVSWHIHLCYFRNYRLLSRWTDK